MQVSLALFIFLYITIFISILTMREVDDYMMDSRHAEFQPMLIDPAGIYHWLQGKNFKQGPNALNIEWIVTSLIFPVIFISGVLACAFLRKRAIRQTAKLVAANQIETMTQAHEYEARMCNSPDAKKAARGRLSKAARRRLSSSI